MFICKGMFLGKAFEIYPDAYASDVRFYPAITLRESEIETNFGGKPFKYLPELFQSIKNTCKNWFEEIPTDLILVHNFP